MYHEKSKLSIMIQQNSTFLFILDCLQKLVIEHIICKFEMPVMKCALCSKLCSQQCVCRKVAYCNDTCQKLDWRRHRMNCPPTVAQVTFINIGRLV